MGPQCGGQSSLNPMTGIWDFVQQSHNFIAPGQRRAGPVFAMTGTGLAIPGPSFREGDKLSQGWILPRFGGPLGRERMRR
jgi:hypothetical protein